MAQNIDSSILEIVHWMMEKRDARYIERLKRTISEIEAEEVQRSEVAQVTNEHSLAVQNQKDLTTAEKELEAAVRPIVKHKSLEEIELEQGEKVFDKNIFFEKAKAVKVEEPIEELLAMLTP